MTTELPRPGGERWHDPMMSVSTTEWEQIARDAWADYWRTNDPGPLIALGLLRPNE